MDRVGEDREAGKEEEQEEDDGEDEEEGGGGRRKVREREPFLSGERMEGEAKENGTDVRRNGRWLDEEEEEERKEEEARGCCACVSDGVNASFYPLVDEDKDG